MQNTWVTWPRIFLGFLKIAILTDFLLFLGGTFKDFWNCKRVTRYFFLETCISEHGDTCVCKKRLFLKDGIKRVPVSLIPVLIAQVVERPLRELEVSSSKSGRAIPKVLKMVQVATLQLALSSTL